MNKPQNGHNRPGAPESPPKPKVTEEKLARALKRNIERRKRAAGPGKTDT